MSSPPQGAGGHGPTKHDFLQGVLGMSVSVSAGVLVAASLGCLFFNQAQWLLGLWAGLVWIAINNYFIFLLLELARSGQASQKNHVFTLCVIKFPILYLAGIGLMIQPCIAAEGVLVTFTVFLFVSAILWMKYPTKLIS